MVRPSETLWKLSPNMEARSADVAPHRQRLLLEHPVLGVRRLMAENPALTPILQSQVVGENMGGVRDWFLSWNPKATREIQRWVADAWDEGDKEPLNLYAGNAACDPRLHLRVARDPQTPLSTLQSLIGNPRLSPEAQAEILNLGSPVLTTQLAKHPRLSLAAQKDILDSAPWDTMDVVAVRAVSALGANPRAHVSVLEGIAREALDGEHPIGRLVCMSLVKNSNLPVVWQERLTSLLRPVELKDAPWVPTPGMQVGYLVEHHPRFVEREAQRASLDVSGVLDLAQGWERSLADLLEVCRLTGGLVAS